MGRQPCCDKVGLKKGPWTSEEDKKLINFILTNGHCCWRAVPKLAGLLRCGKSCRLRWTNYLRPDLKRGLLSESEEQIVIDLHAKLGNRWSKIAANLPGRTDNEIKNHWNTHIKKKLKKMGIDPQTHKPLDSCDGGGQRGEEQMAEVGAGAETASKKFPRSTGEVDEEWKSQSFCTDEVPVILPEEMMVPPASTVTSISPSSPSSSSINSAKVEENQLACINWSESIPWWILDESEGWDLLWDHSEGRLAVEDPFSDYGSSVLDQDSWSFSLQ